MAEKVDVNAKWDACLDLTVRRFVYSSLAGAFSECNRIFDAKLTTPKTSDAPAHEVGY
ncbi:conserved hypothetical protein [Ricinus communis]|uniref:Uncharacterized protein n=1 Tax=Ricinus communis TaxID=3988 RepID=B9S728_RICCO|nr:conserved hypothetical protein [Ricinus communis]